MLTFRGEYVESVSATCRLVGSLYGEMQHIRALVNVERFRMEYGSAIGPT